MLIIPAIDIKEGKCVRLFQGNFQKETVYDDDPIKVATNWQRQGAKLLHIVDLDGAKRGKIKHLGLIAEIAKKVSVPIEVGGGIRDLETIKELFDTGAEKVILTTLAYENPGLLKKVCGQYGEKILVSIDARDGFLSVKGWQEKTGEKAVDFAQRMQEAGVKGFIYTDIKRDGTLFGTNLPGIKKFAASIGGKLVASGGISNLDDIRRIKDLELPNLTGVIVGKALYTKTISLKEAIKVANE
ncbi:MAG: 1-(5-phosphoribosyl)-5-[(5-phosphoribosylamino)methylideneamino]imidazole-4-carboxamide isomerase [Candidatus Omnitrophica bacterium]|nr:1-(5-phosphoribosyl)-5-[(5-phosphoribosylamino)methylideneamino]imidazole-4-carboxamide isomerase [Candidatus Omnitrophota bacterium]